MTQEILKKATVQNIAYVEMCVGNIIQSKNFFINALKFEHIASRKEEDSITFLMKQGDIHILLSSMLTTNSALAKPLQHYGDSIKKIAFWTNNVDGCCESTVKKGAKMILSPQKKYGVYTTSVEVFDGMEHEFLATTSACSKIPGFDYGDQTNSNQPMLFYIDHIALCYPENTIERYAIFYKEALCFLENKNEDIYAGRNGMHIIIMNTPNGKINISLVEPSSESSPLHTYLKYNNGGAGAHHVAFGTHDIIRAVQHYEKQAGELRKASPKYYDQLKQSYPKQLDKIQQIAPHGIMFEQDPHGILFQIFTKPVVTRPTLFFEFIQRQKCKGFGTVNIEALYDSLET